MLGVVGEEPQDHLQAAAPGAQQRDLGVGIDVAGGQFAGMSLRAAAAAVTAWRARVILSCRAGMLAFLTAGVMVFLTLEITEIVLCIGNFNAGAALLPTGTIKAGGYIGLVTALVAWYTSAAGVSNGIASRLRFPVERPLIS